MFANSVAATLHMDNFQATGGRIYGFGATLHNAGEIEVTGSLHIVGGVVNDAGSAIRSSGTGISFQGNLTNNGLIDFTNDSDFTRPQNGNFHNTGTVRKSGGSGETVLTDLNMDGNGQTLDVDTGTLRVNQAGTWSGITTITPAAGAAFRFSRTGDCCVPVTIAGTLTGSGAGTVVLGAGMALRGADGSHTSALDFPAGLFEAEAGAVWSGGGGTMHNAGEIDVTGALHFSGNVVNDEDAVVRSSGDGISFDGHNLTNEGLIDFANDSDFTRTHNGGVHQQRHGAQVGR